MIDRIAQFRQSFHTRKTEQSDTHQYIQRHDPEFHKKKNDDQEGGFKDPYDDLTDVSVAALISFLEGLLDRNTSLQASTESTNSAEETHIQEVRAPVDPAHAQAMNAYQARNPQSIAPSVPKQTTDNDKPQSTLDKAAAALDQTAIKSTIRDLRSLLARGIDHIALERGDGFLESIQNSIANY